MTRNHLLSMKYALPRRSLLAIGIAAAGLLVTPSVSFARDTKELAALKTALAALGGGTDVAAADPQILANAVAQAAANNLRLRIGNIAGEALKYNTNDPGDEIALKIQEVVAAVVDQNKAAAAAAVRASTQVGANATNVPRFASFFVATNAEATSLAKLAIKSTTAIGAILGGRALDADVGAGLRAGVANAGIQDPKLKKAAQQIAQFVGDTVADDNEAVDFAGTVAIANTTQIQRIAVGVTTSNPNAAGGIIDVLLASAATVELTKKNAPKIAKAVGLVASVEQIQLMSSSFGKVVTTRQAISTVKGLIQGISARNPKVSVDGAGSLSKVNKADEVGEVIAYFVAALAKNNAAFDATFASEKKAAGLIFSIAKTVFVAAKVKAIKSIGQKSDALQAQLLVLAGNFGASLAFTLQQLQLQLDITPAVLEAIKSKLQKSAAAIGGKRNSVALQAQFNAGFAVGATGFEDGTAVGSVIDPETDTRNG